MSHTIIEFTPTGALRAGIEYKDLPDNQQKEVLAQCNAAACTDAKDAMQPARNEIRKWCQRIQTKQREVQAAALAAAGLAAVSAGAFGALAAAAQAGVVFWVLVAMLVAALLIGAAAIIAAAVAAVREGELNGYRRQVSALQTQWDVLADAVTRNCPEQCRNDLDVPMCP